MAHTTLSTLFSPSFITTDEVHVTLGEEFHLCDNGSMSFHWSDFHETCDGIKDQMERDPGLREDYQRRESALGRLNLIPVWIKTRSKIHQTTMHELYERHILNKSKLLEGMDFFGPLQVSLISGTGPFKSMAVSEFFNKETYQDFIMVNLLKGNLPRRDFRIRLQSRVLVEFGHDFEKAELIQLEQLTMHGLLLSIDSNLFTKEVSKCEKLRILLSTQTLDEARGKSIPELKTYLSQFTFNLMYSSRKQDSLEFDLRNVSPQSSFDFLKSKKVYFFIPYKNLTCENSDRVESMLKFVNFARELVREHYRSLSARQSA